MRIWGINAGLEILKVKSERIKWIALLDDNGRRGEIYKLALEKGIPVQFRSKRELWQLALEHDEHQGVVADCPRLIDYVNWKEFVEDDFVVFPYKIQDPHNLGAIVRTAVFMGVLNFLLVKKGGLSTITGAVVKASSGAAAYARFCNWASPHIVKNLKEEGFKVVAFDLAGDVDLEEFVWPDKTLLILGSEGSGFKSSKFGRNLIDHMVKIRGNFESLNVSNTFAIAMWDRRLKVSKGGYK